MVRKTPKVISRATDPVGKAMEAAVQYMLELTQRVYGKKPGPLSRKKK
jgi:hypothetical protein